MCCKILYILYHSQIPSSLGFFLRLTMKHHPYYINISPIYRIIELVEGKMMQTPEDALGLESKSHCFLQTFPGLATSNKIEKTAYTVENSWTPGNETLELASWKHARRWFQRYCFLLVKHGMMV